MPPSSARRHLPRGERVLRTSSSWGSQHITGPVVQGESRNGRGVSLSLREASAVEGASNSMTDHSGEVIESQADWLTVTTHGREKAARLLDYSRTLAERERQGGNRVRQLRLMGYALTHVGRVEYGSRDDESAMLRLIGDSANRYLDEASGLGDYVTRLDMAVTYRADPRDLTIGPRALAQASEYYAAHPRAAVPWSTSDANQGHTTYVGKRDSAQLLRIYNKEAECLATGDDDGLDRYIGCWRFELEAHDSFAANIHRALLDHEDRPAFVQAYLHQYCQAHGITPPFQPRANAS